MALKIGINGFGRIGRLVFRALIDKPRMSRSSKSMTLLIMLLWHNC